MTFKVTLSGFDTKEEALGFLNWFEGQGEQDDTIGQWMGANVKCVQCDVQSGLKEHLDGFEYRIKTYYR